MCGRTILEALDWGKLQLKSLGSSEAGLNTERLLEEVIGCDRASLYLEAHQKIPAIQRQKFKRLILQRKKRIPLDYLLKRTHFWNEILEVGPGCLIPRPSTEILVEKFIEKSGFSVKDGSVSSGKKSGAFSFLDLCCGSGAIGIALLREFPKATATFADVSREALQITKRNLKRYKILDRAKVIQSDLFESMDPRLKHPGMTSIKWDAILCNPPYLSADDLKKAQPEILKEPRLALDGGKDGLEIYRRVISEAPRFLKPEGLLVFEVGKGQAGRIARACRSSFKKIEIFKDYLHIDRVLIARLNG